MNDTYGLEDTLKLWVLLLKARDLLDLVNEPFESISAYDTWKKSCREVVADINIEKIRLGDGNE